DQAKTADTAEPKPVSNKTLVSNCTSRKSPVIFYFSGHRSHPDPDSFPTRRSSDLARRSSGASATLRRSTPSCGAAGVSANASASDRKSTRLNSSHVSISYAVFCLKKKKHSVAVVFLVCFAEVSHLAHSRPAPPRPH